MTGNPVGLVEFLLARLDNEARPTFELVPYECEPGCCAPAGWVGHRCLICETTFFGGTVEAITETCREHEESIHRRSYVLRDIAAKRRIIEKFKPKFHRGGTVGAISTPEGVLRDVAITYMTDPGNDLVLRLLAAPFSSHPDWQPEWSTE